MSIRIYPCCEHCIPEADGRCWAATVGHGAHCLECQGPEDYVTPPTPDQPAQGASDDTTER